MVLIMSSCEHFIFRPLLIKFSSGRFFASLHKNTWFFVAFKIKRGVRDAYIQGVKSLQPISALFEGLSSLIISARYSY